MGSADAYEIAWQTMLSPLKLIFIILVVFLSIIIIYSISLQREEIDFDKIELFEVSRVLIDCVTENSIIQYDKFNEEYLKSCANVKKYGIKLILNKNTFIINDPVYSSYSGFCNRLAACHELEYKDLNGDVLDIEVVFKNE